ncbi:MAG: N,N-dimethyltransferase [Candidatus Solibacter sp.]|nr:N,N-dimethyltransferase [Candidatus Solibacter sp.]
MFCLTGLVAVARAKNPAGEFHVADMRTFELDKRYDVVQGLFGSIGYLLTRYDIVAALSRFRSTSSPGESCWSVSRNVQSGDAAHAHGRPSPPQGLPH